MLSLVESYLQTVAEHLLGSYHSNLLTTTTTTTITTISITATITMILTLNYILGYTTITWGESR